MHPINRTHLFILHLIRYCSRTQIRHKTKTKISSPMLKRVAPIHKPNAQALLKTHCLRLWERQPSERGRLTGWFIDTQWVDRTYWHICDIRYVCNVAVLQRLINLRENPILNETENYLHHIPSVNDKYCFRDVCCK